MLILIAISILMIIPLAMQIVQTVRSAFAYHWLMATLAAMISFGLVFFSRGDEEQIITLTRWMPEAYFATSPELLIDFISWSFAVTLVALCLAVILAAVVQRPQAGWNSWAGTLLLTAFGLVAVTAGNPLTLILSWSALDLFEALVLFSWVRRSEARSRMLMALGARGMGSAFLIWSVIVARAGGSVLTFSSIPASVSPYLLVAAGLRLGVLPMQPPYLQDSAFHRGLGTPLKLIPVIASLVLLARAAGSQMVFGAAPYLLAVVGFSGIYSAVSWFMSSSELSGRPFWILGMASLAFVAAVRMQPAACISWSIACICSGSILFLFSVRSKGTMPIPLLGALALAAFPLTPTWPGLAVYTPAAQLQIPYFDFILNLTLLLTHIGLVLGYIRQTLRGVEPKKGLERWVWIIYPLGLIVMLLLEYYLGWQIGRYWTERPAGFWWVGGIVLVLMAAMWLSFRQSARFAALINLSKRMANSGSTIWGKVLSLEWSYGFAWSLYHILARGIDRLTQFLEGDGGILWALVFLLFLFAISFQGGFSG